ncbi:DUF2563 family protein [Nocardia sp. 2]|uniref:DUF2563 family protein n=1 Tax=Nocardia acididurans TaxID=2802282 RepID=A0ABS1M2W1_9NOCA|nr:DUF2563 family protein [Nocardia acididurans]MBL1075002.1 DUF2563 family protein [Nocardia acididurans]
MLGLSIDPDSVTAYTATAHLLAGDLTAASILAATADPLLLTPAFGLIGADFLTAFTAAHATHTATLTTLSATLTGIGSTAAASAAGYRSTDTGHAAALRAVEANI